MRLQDLEEFLKVQHIPRLELRPHRDIIEAYLKGSSGQEVCLQHVTNKEGHEAREDLVLLGPGPGSGPGLRRLCVQESEWTASRDDQHQGQQLQVEHQVPQVPVYGSGGVVATLDAQLWVDLVDGPGIVLECFTVASGNAVLKAQQRPQAPGARPVFARSLVPLSGCEPAPLLGLVPRAVFTVQSQVNISHGEGRKQEKRSR